MPEVYDNRTITMIFREDNDGLPEIEIIKSIFVKVSAIAKEPGYKRKFTPNEVEMIKGLDSYINKQTKNLEKQT
jgi:hypothetical protein